MFIILFCLVELYCLYFSDYLNTYTHTCARCMERQSDTTHYTVLYKAFLTCDHMSFFLHDVPIIWFDLVFDQIYMHQNKYQILTWASTDEITLNLKKKNLQQCNVSFSYVIWPWKCGNDDENNDDFLLKLHFVPP